MNQGVTRPVKWQKQRQRGVGLEYCNSKDETGKVVEIWGRVGEQGGIRVK